MGFTGYANFGKDNCQTPKNIANINSNLKKSISPWVILEEE